MPLIIYLLQQQNDEFLDQTLISDPEYADTIHHSYPLGTICHVTGCYTDFVDQSQKALQNASCTVSQPPSPVMSTPTLPSSSLSPSTSHPPPSRPILTTTATVSSSPSILPSSTLQVLASSLSTSAKGAQSPLLAAIVACVAVSLALLCILLLVVGWYHSRTHRKIIKVGANNWRTEGLKSDYLPVDLCKPLVPVFTSHESLINNLYTPEPTSRHSLTPAPLPLTGQPAQPPTEATTDRQTHHNSFLRELSPVREGEVGGGGEEWRDSGCRGGDLVWWCHFEWQHIRLQHRVR
ncbi:hypothetical protein GBAR_LOCUS15625 [Geodia barretti]|uniref:Uncharacterized protein n=1 Tax=Geodia barretti TaxID=519541 RepID=A0AA35SBZ7_GEOBA|nr:hypothetical protein GBAR_LOCUS15625 [Geodia barretti]